MKKLLFIYNPNAGKKRITAKLGEVAQVFSAAGYDTTLHATRCRGDATVTAAQQAAGYDLVVCCGGDGTLNEVVSGLAGRKDVPPLGYLPAGTTNDFSRTLKLPTTLVRAAQTAVEGSPFACDMGRFNERNFVYVAAFGVFTEVSYSTPQAEKNLLGHLAYVLRGVRSLNSLRHYSLRVTHDGVTEEGEYIYGMVTDSVSVGGFRGVAPKAVELDDGKFEVMLVKRPKTPDELAGIITALVKQQPNGNVVGFQTARLTVESETPIPWTLDGEFGGDTCRAEIENLPRAVTLMRGWSK